MKSLASFQAETLTDIRQKDEHWFFSQLANKCQEVIEKGKDFLIVCPFHDDHSPSCGVDRWHGFFRCFSCGESGGWNKLAKALDMERIDHSKEDVKTRTSRALERAGVRTKRAKRSRPLVEPWPDGTAWRGLDSAFLRGLGVVKVVDLKHSVIRIGLPVRNSTGALMGYTCRAVEPETADRNAWQAKELPTKSVLYLIDKAVQLDWDRFFLVEGPYDALRLWYYGVPAMATLGAGNWSQEKAAMVIGLSPKKVLVMMDNDRAGAEAQATIIKQLRSSVRTAGIGLPCKDPGSLSEKQVAWLADKLKSS
jgi:hypothetical protein